jgi:hypothetical protein
MLPRELRVGTQLSREPTAVTVSLRPPPPCSSFFGVDSSSRRTTSTAFSSSMILGCLLFSVLVMSQALVSGDPRNVPFGEVPGVLVKRVIAAEDVDEGQDDLVWRVVDVYGDPADSLVAFA